MLILANTYNKFISLVRGNEEMYPHPINIYKDKVNQ